MSSQSPEQRQSAARKRKLDLVKCERCRLDKQKCLPAKRAWPTRCDRCVEKDFPCSEGKRVARKSKHTVTQTPDPPTTPEYHTSAADIAQFRTKIHQWLDLTSYHKIMDMAMRRLHSLKRETMELFDDSDSRKDSFAEVPEGDDIRRLSTFYSMLEHKLLQITTEVTFFGSPPGDVGSRTVSALMLKAMPIFSWHSRCPICFNTGEHFNLVTLTELGDACGEYVARLSRLSHHFQTESHPGDASGSLVKRECARLKALSFQVNLQASVVLKELNLFHVLPPMSQAKPLFRPDAIIRETFEDEMEADCLGRTGLHQILDAVNDYDWEHLERLCHWPSDQINEQDIMGRTPLHIACQRGWIRGVEELLIKGANPGLKTVCGSLPLHYAAAGGSTIICSMLQPVNGDAYYDVNATDWRGNTALYYALGANIEVTKALLRAPFSLSPNGGRGETLGGSPLPFSRAVFSGSAEMVRLLLEFGASLSIFTMAFFDQHIITDEIRGIIVEHVRSR